MAVVAAAPCQCFSPGENQSTSPDESWLEGDMCVPKVGGWNCKNFKTLLARVRSDCRTRLNCRRQSRLNGRESQTGLRMSPPFAFILDNRFYR
jgi:hypothetical protein